MAKYVRYIGNRGASARDWAKLSGPFWDLGRAGGGAKYVPNIVNRRADPATEVSADFWPGDRRVEGAKRLAEG